MTIRFIVGFMFGASLAATVVLALAPQPGYATRRQLLQKVRERTGQTG